MADTPESPEFAADEIRVFSRLREAGFRPPVIFDIGAANGTWSALIDQVFPEAVFHLFEPLAGIRDDYRKSLDFQLRCHPNFSLHNVALGSCEKKIEMCVHDDGYGSTILEMGAHPEYQKRIEVNQYALDAYVRVKGIGLPSIIKIDTQGAERLILGQAPTCLQHAEVVFAETWLIRGYGPETPLLGELMDLLAASDLVLAEIGHRFYHEEHDLYGCDAFFLKKDFLKALTGRMPQQAW